MSSWASASNARSRRWARGWSILGHHYQQDAVIEFADFTGDSFELSRKAAEQKGVEYVIFCGVHFMAESADILTDDNVRVILPDLGAGCSMADMANLDQTIECWAQLEEACPDQLDRAHHLHEQLRGDQSVRRRARRRRLHQQQLPQCAGMGRWAGGGRRRRRRSAGKRRSVSRSCSSPTSTSVATPLMRWAIRWRRWRCGTPAGLRRQRSRNPFTKPTSCCGKATAPSINCSAPSTSIRSRQKYPNMKVMVHPECRWEVVQKADLAGSTAYIVKQIEAAAPGSEWAIGTEVHLVSRLARQHPEQKIIVLSDCQCLCTTMYRIDLPHLCWALENLVEGKVVNQIKVDAETRKWATVALERMLAIKGTGNPIGKQQPLGTTID